MKNYTPKENDILMAVPGQEICHVTSAYPDGTADIETTLSNGEKLSSVGVSPDKLRHEFIFVGNAVKITTEEQSRLRRNSTSLATSTYATKLGFHTTSSPSEMVMPMPGRIGRKLWIVGIGETWERLWIEDKIGESSNNVCLHDSEIDGRLTAGALKKIVEAIS